jgi:hypothetical protein
VVHGIDVKCAFCGHRIGGGETVVVDKGNRLFAVAWVEDDVLESALVVKGGDVFIEGFWVWLGSVDGAVGEGGDPFVGGA